MSDHSEGYIHSDGCSFDRLLEKRLAEARERALEEAALAIEGMTTMKSWDAGHVIDPDQAAFVVRALKETKP